MDQSKVSLKINFGTYDSSDSDGDGDDSATQGEYGGSVGELLETPGLSA